MPFLRYFFSLQNSTFHSRKWLVQPWSSRVNIARTENTRDSRKAGERRPLFRIPSEVTERDGVHHRDDEKRESVRDKRHATCKKPPIGNKRTGGDCTVCLSACLLIGWCLFLCLFVGRLMSVFLHVCWSVDICVSVCWSVGVCLSIVVHDKT